MAGRKPLPKRTAADDSSFGRLVPTQARSRERFERILECSAQLIAEKGSEAFRISDVVERSKVPFGSLYQYFPDKTAIIGTLAERYNAVGRMCVHQDLLLVNAVSDLHPALCRIVDSYYQMFMDEPVMRDIWQATQADRDLQKLDEEDGRFLAELMAETVRRISPETPASSVETFSQLTMTLIAAVVRHAIALESAAAKRLLTLFKDLLPKDLASVR